MSRQTTTSRTSRRREREREARIALIRNAGTRVFSRYGYRMATMEMVAREAELGKASLYYYYGAKQELFADIVAQAASDLSAGLSRVVEPGGYSAGEPAWDDGGAPERSRDANEALTTLGAILRFALDYFAAHRDLLALVLPLIAAGPDRLEEIVGREVAAQVLKAHAPVFYHLEPLSRLLPPGGPLSSVMASFLIGLATKVLYGSERDLEEELDLFMGLLRRALLARP